MEEVPGAQRRSTTCARSPVWRGGCERGHSAPSLAPPSSAQPAKGSRFPHLADRHAEAQGGEALAEGHGSVSGRAEMLTQAPLEHWVTLVGCGKAFPRGQSTTHEGCWIPEGQGSLPEPPEHGP